MSQPLLMKELELLQWKAYKNSNQLSKKEDQQQLVVLHKLLMELLLYY
jgi:hypothetical protein